jgi:hypothetical protein
MVTILVKTASTPKASGEYKRVRMGLMSTNNPWLIKVPEERITIFLLKSE